MGIENESRQIRPALWGTRNREKETKLENEEN
jgi:hypothetical protein